MDQLNDSRGPDFVMLDIKLSTGMAEMLRKAGNSGKRVRERVELKMEESTRKGTNIIKGRQIVWMVCESFKCFDQSEVVYGFDHLGLLKVHNNDLHDFLIRWNHILENMGDKLTDMQMRDVVFRKIQFQPGLEQQIAAMRTDQKNTRRRLTNIWLRASISGSGETNRGRICWKKNRYYRIATTRPSVKKSPWQLLPTKKEKGAVKESRKTRVINP